MEPQIYTHALWRVKPGSEEAFIQAWSELAEAFSSLDRPPLWGTLIRSSAQPNLFYSFGPWQDEADVERMRVDPAAQGALAALVELCEEATPISFHLVRHVDVKK